MNLIFFPPLGGSLQNLANRGELERFEKSYIKAYGKRFSNLFYCSYNPADANVSGLIVLLNKFKWHRYLWQIFMPFQYRKQLENSICRVMQLDGLLPSVLAKIFWSSKIVVTYGYDYSKFATIDRKYFQSVLYFLYEMLLLPFSDLTIVPSFEIFKKLRKNPLIAKKIVNIPNGVDTDIFFVPKLKTKSSKTRLLSIGRLEKQKNYQFLIKSLSSRANLINKFSLTIIGDGTEKPEIERLCRSHGIEFNSISKVAHSKLPSQYQSCDIYIQPSIIEGSPKTLLEAMSCGCCVMASNVPGNREIVDDGKNGYLFELNEKSFLEKLELVAANKDIRNKVGREARETILKNHSIKDNLVRETKLVAGLI